MSTEELTRFEELQARLTNFFPSNDGESREPYTDSAIDEIAHLLELLREPAYASKHPRTYIVLRTIGHLSLLDELLQQGFGDTWLPVEPRSLPPSFTPSIRSAFASAQSLVLTRSLNLEHGKHCHFPPNEPLPFEIKSRLGSGAFSQVDKVQSRISFRYYALKRMRRRKVFGNDSKEGFKMFLSEVQIVKSIEHEHVVKFVGSYTDKNYLGILLSPVAEMDLSRYLNELCMHIRDQERGAVRTNTLVDEMSSSLRTFFGCLTAALAFLHENRIRHKDIKPQNILIAQGTVIFTDFGLSRHFAEGQGSTTSGITAATPRYSPPEVVAYSSRNTSSDIWSLGCVFIEMAAALLGESIEEIKSYFHAHGSKEPHYSTNLEACSLYVERTKRVCSQEHRKPWDLVHGMLRTERTIRPTAAELLCNLTESDDGQLLVTTFCGICCMPGGDSESHDSLAEEFDELTVIPRSRLSSVSGLKRDSRQLQEVRNSEAMSPSNGSETIVDRHHRPEYLEQLNLARSSTDSSQAPSSTVMPLTREASYGPQPTRVTHALKLDLDVPEPNHSDTEHSGTSKNVNPMRTAAASASHDSGLLFGASLREGIQRYGVQGGIGGQMIGKIPFIVQACCDGLIDSALDHLCRSHLFSDNIQLDPNYMELRTLFESRTYTRSSGFDGPLFALTLLRYLHSLPDPLVPKEQAMNMRLEFRKRDSWSTNRLRDFTNFISSPKTPSERWVFSKQHIKKLLVDIPDENLVLLLYLLNFVDEFLGKRGSKCLKCTDYFADSFRVAILGKTRRRLVLGGRFKSDNQDALDDEYILGRIFFEQDLHTTVVKYRKSFHSNHNVRNFV